jgi:hypothetical protein
MRGKTKTGICTYCLRKRKCTYEEDNISACLILDLDPMADKTMLRGEG